MDYLGNRKRVIAAISASTLMLGMWQITEGGYLEAKAWLAQYLLQQAWNETLNGESQAKPWPWADTWPVAKLQVKRLGVERIVLADASGRSMAFGPGQVSGTSQFGQGGNSAISGHRDTHFRFLQQLVQGDQVNLTLRDGSQHSYQVASSSVHNKDETWLLQDSGEETLTLITCYPFDAIVPGGPMRYVVRARPVVF
jgi:sortase A